MTKIPYYSLENFTGLHNELIRKFGEQLTDTNMNVRLKARDSSLEFMREQGFCVDNTFDYVDLPDNKEEHFMMMLKWS